MTMTKKKYLVVYDYGQGGVWAFVCAESPEQIAAAFPELQVVGSPPDWMTPALVQEIAHKLTVDIDDRASGFLASIIRSRSD